MNDPQLKIEVEWRNLSWRHRLSIAGAFARLALGAVNPLVTGGQARGFVRSAPRELNA